MTTLSEAQLYEEYKGYVHYHAKRYSKVSPSHYDDLVQAGFMGLILGARKWREDGGANLTTWVTPWIKQYMSIALDELASAVRIPKKKRKEIGLKRADSTSSADASESDSGLRMRMQRALATPATQEDAFAEHERANIVRKTVASLPKHMRDMVTMVLVDGCTYREVAGKCQCSPQHVHNIVQDAHEQLRERLAELSDDA